MPRIMVSIPALAVTGRGWEKNKEVYVLALATDLRGADPGRNDGPVAAYNETLPNVAPEIRGAAAMEWVVLSVSNVFTRVRPDQPVSLSGSGIILYPNLDPQGMLALHLVVVESDASTRDLGRILSEILDDRAVQTAVSALTAAVTQPLLAHLMNVLIARIPKVLSKNHDDILFTHNHSGFDFDRYGLPPGSTQGDFPIGNDMARCTLRVREGE
jgi:hypothetical protein